jgi:hypothetical protein
VGETGSEAGIGMTEEHEADIKAAIDRGDAEIGLYDAGISPQLGLGMVVCDHWGRLYWHRPELRKLVKIYDPTSRVDTAVVRQLNKSMTSNRNLKMAIRELRGQFVGDDPIGLALDEILRMS